MEVIVLGAGLVGNLIARDLSKDFSVTIADINKETLTKMEKQFGIKSIHSDLSKPAKIQEIIKSYDLVVGALPGFLGFQAVKATIEAGKNMVDISFFPEDPFKLDALAKEKEASVVIDAGVAPGLSNIILGHGITVLDKTESFSCYVGGLPVERTLPWQYKAPFSPIDVIEEYTRPARLKEKGIIVEKEPLSDAEYINFPQIGTLEAFNTDGLRTVLKTIDVPNMKEKTLRYPGHIAHIKFLKEVGFFAKDSVRLKTGSVRPIDLSSKLLIDQWKLNEGEEDLTVMRILISGEKNNKPTTLQYDLFDKYDREMQVLSMARTTGFTCTAITRLMSEGKINRKGIVPPEELGKDRDSYAFIISELKKRKISIEEKEIRKDL
ncbi:MAG: saccharopine dehydrogenase family protein [Candidatus Heimdallarchaeaceae archaeon]